MRITGHPIGMFFCGPGDDGYTGLRMNIEGAPPPTGGSPPPPPPPQGDTTKVTEVTAPWAASGDKPWTIGDAANPQPWHAAIPEAPVKELIAQKGYANPGVLATAYFNLNKLVSTEDASKAIIPKPDADTKAWDDFFAKVGRPANADGYNDVFKFPETVKVDPEMIKFGKGLAHKIGLNPKQAKVMADGWNEFVAAETQRRQAAENTANATAVAKLKATWGTEADEFIAAGKRAYKGLGLSDETVNAIETNIGAAPIVELLARLGKAFSEGSFKGGGGGGGPGGSANSMTPEAAAAEITRLMGDAEFQGKYTNRGHAENKTAIDHMNQLFARAGDKYKG